MKKLKRLKLGEIKIMAARKRTLKNINKAIESAKRQIASYVSLSNPDMVKHYKKHLADAVYIKSLIEKDINKK